MNNINRINELANEIGQCISSEIVEQQKRLFDSRVSLEGMLAVIENTMMTQQQRTAINDSRALIEQALNKIESAWKLRPLDAAPQQTVTAENITTPVAVAA